MSRWIAENVPAYLIFPGERGPLTDEDAAMGARIIIAVGDSRDSAARALSSHLHDTANVRHVQLNGESEMYRAAAKMLDASRTTDKDPELMLKIWGRVYQVRKEG